MLQDGWIGRIQLPDRFDLVDIQVPEGMHEDHVTCLQLVQVGKWPCLPIWQRNMAGKHTVTRISREGAAFQPSSLVQQPVDIPGIVLHRNAHNRHLELERRNLQGHIIAGIVLSDR